MTDATPNDERREVSPELVAAVLGYLEVAVGPHAVDSVLDQIPGRPTVAELTRHDNWCSRTRFDEIARLAAEATGDSRVGRQVGVLSYRALLDSPNAGLIRSLGSVPSAVSAMADYASKMSIGRRMEIVEVGHRHVLMSGRYADDVRPHQYSCDLVTGFFGELPGLFDQLGTAAEIECQCRGDERCLYRITWLPDPLHNDGTDVRTGLVRGMTALEQLESYHEAAAELVRATDVNDVLRRIVEQVSSAIKAPAFGLSVHLPGEAEPRVHHRGFDDPGDAHALAASLARGERPPEAVVAPVTGATGASGHLVAVLPEGTAPSDYDHRTLRSYARYAASALEIVAALEETRTARDTASALLDLAHLVAVSTEITEVGRHLAQALAPGVGSDLSSVWLADEDGTELYLVESCDRDGRPVDPGIDRLTSAIPDVDALLAEHTPRFLQVQHMRGAERALMDRLGIREVVLVPILSKGALVGMASVGFRDPVAADRRLTVLERVHGMAHQAALAFENLRLVEEMKERALHDDLTGLPNRSLADDRCSQALSRRARNGGQVAVLFLDLDGFKAVNDSLGHMAGDDLLCQVGERLSALLRASDTCARLGGDEFLLLLPDLDDADQAVEVARRVLDAFSEPFTIAETEVSITPSIGVVTAGNDDRFEDLLRRSDAAMYRAKALGHGTYSVG